MATKEVFRAVPGGTVTIAPTTSSAATSLGTLDESINAVRVYNAKPTDVFAKLTTSGGSATTTTDIPIPSGQAYDLARAGDTHIALIGTASDGNVYVTPGTYVKV